MTNRLEITKGKYLARATYNADFGWFLVVTYEGGIVPGFRCKYYANRKNAEAAARKFLATC